MKSSVRETETIIKILIPACCPITKASNISHFHCSHFFALYFPSQYQWFFLSLLPFLILRPWQTRTHCCRHIVAHDVSWAAQTGKQNVSEKNQRHFLCPGHKICVRNKCCPRGQTGKHLCRQQMYPQQCVLVCQGLYVIKCFHLCSSRKNFILVWSKPPRCATVKVTLI